MKVLGLDIGTTTISAVVIDEGRTISSATLSNGAFLADEQPWEKVQDAEYIQNTALGIVESMFTDHPDIQRIGITGQMHGIVYLDSDGNLLSPLYTWQDGRGNQPYSEEETYAQYISRITGYDAATGFGLVTHFYNQHNNLIPERTAVFCTIHDYVAMILSGRHCPVTEASDASSLGLFDVKDRCFDIKAIKKLGIDCGLLPKVSDTDLIGYYREDVPVFNAIGDNQASYIGAVNGCKGSMLVNIGTGGQFSVYTEKHMTCEGLETRPFPGGGYLLVGSSLCSGRAYALLEKLFRDIAEGATGIKVGSCYEYMERMLETASKPEGIPIVSPLFQGTRKDPTLTGSIEGLTVENFSPRYLVWGMLEGMTDELYEMYCNYQKAQGASVSLYGSGNGLRKNRYLQGCIREKFDRGIIMSDCIEEAATGAALFAAGQRIDDIRP